MNIIKKFALITGASSGIGYEISKIFAKNNHNLILVGRNYEALKKLKSEINDNIKVEILQINLSNIDELYKLYDYIKNKNYFIDILVNNAGLGYNGYFDDIKVEKNVEIIDVNIKALTILTNLLVKDMKKNRCGKILNVASTGAYQPGPMISVYYASKAYVLSLTYALREELKIYGITVSALSPGTTKTNFSKRAGKGDLNIAMSAEKVAKIAYYGLEKGKANIIPGSMNKLLVFMSKVSPNLINSKIVNHIQKKAINKK